MRPKSGSMPFRSSRIPAFRSGDMRTAGRFFRGLGRFLEPVPLPEHRRRLLRQLGARERAFAEVLERCVFRDDTGPYRALFRWAAIGLEDVTPLLASDGLERTLARLLDAGVYLKLEEFKGLRPIRRPGLDLEVEAEAFDNPFPGGYYEAQTGGSSGVARRILVDLDLLEHESAYHSLFLSAIEADDRPLAIWYPAPPGVVGIKTALIHAKRGQPAECWFSQNRFHRASLRHAVFTMATIFHARAYGAQIPLPEFTPAQDASRVVAWLAERRSRGTAGIVVTTPSAAVRVCTAAVDGKLDIAESTFILVGEPYTPAKAAAVASTGSRAFSHYAMAEAGMIGVACGSADAPDDVHLTIDKVATIQRETRIGASQETVPALYHTTLLPSSPKVMLNVESGDYGVCEVRDCGCEVLPVDFRTHLHTIRSYEKSTSEGMNFLGTDLLALVEQILPARFGGHSTDYQFVERERSGLPKVSLVVSRAVGELDVGEVARTVLEFWRRRGSAEALMADIWAQAGTLEVVRGDAHVTSGGKVLPLRVLSD